MAGRVVRVLNVAEKNDAAKGIAHFLSNGQSQRRETFSKYNKMFEFDLHIQQFGANLLKMAVTSVSGHLLQIEFDPGYRNWRAVPVVSLFDAPINRVCEKNMTPLKRTLEQEARKAQHLIIWTDCDREGENIGFEVIEVCTRVNPRLTVHSKMELQDDSGEQVPQYLARATCVVLYYCFPTSQSLIEAVWRLFEYCRPIYNALLDLLLHEINYNSRVSIARLVYDIFVETKLVPENSQLVLYSGSSLNFPEFEFDASESQSDDSESESVNNANRLGLFDDSDSEYSDEF